MRFLAEGLLGVGLIGAVGLGIAWLFGSGKSGAQIEDERWLLVPSTWVALHTTVESTTDVIVQKRKVLQTGEIRVLEVRDVEKIPNDDPHYDDRFSRAMAVARERAAVLNASGGND
jgi:hypothetical protein